MKIAIMQPYFFPYIGYFQLMNAVDEFIIYDNIQFSKKGWINRNRILVNGSDSYITLPLKKDSDYLEVVQRYLADDWPNERRKLLNRITESYRKAPQFKTVYPIIEQIILAESTNLFQFIYNSLDILKTYLDINTRFVVSSTIAIDHHLKAEEKVLALCLAQNATTYINPIGGVELYDKQHFAKAGVNLHFLKADAIQYPQLGQTFIPFLSIIDVLMFNDLNTVKHYLNTAFTLH